MHLFLKNKVLSGLVQRKKVFLQLVFESPNGPELYSQNVFLATYQCSKQARVFLPGKLFQRSLMFTGKARSLPKSGVSERRPTQVRPWLYKHQTRLQKPVRDSILFCKQ